MISKLLEKGEKVDAVTNVRLINFMKHIDIIAPHFMIYTEFNIMILPLLWAISYNKVTYLLRKYPVLISPFRIILLLSISQWKLSGQTWWKLCWVMELKCILKVICFSSIVLKTSTIACSYTCCNFLYDDLLG